MSKLDMSGVTRAFHKVGFSMKKHSPEILVVTGVVGVVVSAVMACKATTKVSGIVEKAKKDINDIHDVAADAEAGIIEKEELMEWFPNGKNSIRLTFKDNNTLVFTYNSKTDWILESKKSFVNRLKNINVLTATSRS